MRKSGGVFGVQLAEKAGLGEKNIPQRLKPSVLAMLYGTAKAVPLPSNSFFRSR
ncbi:MAG: hypothetical protein WA414_18005 [Acidobacteriaceae bacterium]